MNGSENADLSSHLTIKRLMRLTVLALALAIAPLASADMFNITVQCEETAVEAGRARCQELRTSTRLRVGLPGIG